VGSAGNMSIGGILCRVGNAGCADCESGRSRGDIGDRIGIGNIAGRAGSAIDIGVRGGGGGGGVDIDIDIDIDGCAYESRFYL
jgi:hypothetical protein